MKRPVFIALLGFFVLWHAVAVWSQWSTARNRVGGADFASYYYAVKVAKEGNDPYRKRELSKLSLRERTRTSVHPFFYPPPFVLATAWVDTWTLQTAYTVWFWFDEIFTLLCGLVLWRWWRELGDGLPILIAASIAVLSAVPNNHMMGQANLPVLFLVLFGLWQEDEGREVLGGVAVGTACMLKMSPALFVAWWLLRWRWRPALAACVTAVVLTLMSLAIVDAAWQWRFYTQVMPKFANGNYNGLRIPIDMFGNHSLPNVLHQGSMALDANWGESLGGFARSGPHKLSKLTQEVSRYAALAFVLVLGTAWWAEVDDKLRRWAQISCVGVVMLMIPVYTYEHHVVWAIPAVVIVGMGLWHGRLPRWTAVPYLWAVAWWAFELAALKPYWMAWKQSGDTALSVLLAEQKFVALVILLVMTAVLGRSEPDSGAQ